jgi:O-antigen/teichoic acid export membrane protein
MKAVATTKTFRKRFSDGSLTKKASLNAVATGLDYGARTVVGFLIQPLMVSFLGDFGYGVWQVLDRSVGYISPATGRPTQALKMLIARSQGSTDFAEKRKHVGSAVAIWLFALPLMLLLGFPLAWYIPQWLETPVELIRPVRITTALLVLNLILVSLLTLPKSVLEGENLGYKRMGLSTFLVILSGLFVVGPLYLGWGLIGMGLASVLTTLTTGLLFWQVARTQLPWFGMAWPDRGFIRRFLGLSGWFQLWNFVMRTMRTGDVILLGFLGSPTLVTIYSLTRYVPETLADFITTVVFGVTPGLGGLIGRGETKAAAKVRGELMSITWLLTAVIGTGVLLWNRSFMALWTDERYFAGDLANLLIIVMVIQFALIRNDANIIDLTLEMRVKVLIGLAATGIGLGLSALFLYLFGPTIIALALGVILGRLLLSVAYPQIVGQTLALPLGQQVRAIVRPLLVTVFLFSGAIYLSEYGRVNSWLGLIAAGAITGMVTLGIAYYGGLTGEMRHQLGRRFKGVVQ